MVSGGRPLVAQHVGGGEGLRGLVRDLERQLRQAALQRQLDQQREVVLARRHRGQAVLGLAQPCGRLGELEGAVVSAGLLQGLARVLQRGGPGVHCAFGALAQQHVLVFDGQLEVGVLFERSDHVHGGVNACCQDCDLGWWVLGGAVGLGAACAGARRGAARRQQNDDKDYEEGAASHGAIVARG